ncbi:argininosuccinate lyase [Colletotrichum tofieldiae]|nr:argininosuccinate lyase [Colletotrichum tofieldiae]
MGYAVSPDDLPVPGRDTYFWLGEINKASAVINSDEGLLDRGAACRIASGLEKLLDSGNEPNAPAQVLLSPLSLFSSKQLALRPLFSMPGGPAKTCSLPFQRRSSAMQC